MAERFLLAHGFEKVTDEFGFTFFQSENYIIDRKLNDSYKTTGWYLYRKSGRYIETFKRLRDVVDAIFNMKGEIIYV